MNWLENVKSIKKKKGLTNEALSERSEISIGTLNKLLSGATGDPKLSTLTALAEAFGCSLDEMLTGKAQGEELTSEERDIITKLRMLDAGGKETALYIINKEYRCTLSEKIQKAFSAEPQKILSLKLYDIAASAGTGSVLTSEVGYSKINVYCNPTTELADFAIRVSGNSMNPKYQDGDILLVSDADEIERGELGIFMLNGESYFKKFGGDRLISLNPEYSDIIFGEGDNIKCFGRVIGRLKR